ncbi:hypothetical protein ElyMa_000192000 [Elysia marginata]|uniref:Uncharacterized protein n=1 Tax=Elysia marginata TaxID=1093978 RepID=A0AAV4EUT6_9GAST|nr:hypothetical protein ElyMa_000192000 [Elysia marginata]
MLIACSAVASHYRDIGSAAVTLVEERERRQGERRKKHGGRATGQRLADGAARHGENHIATSGYRQQRRSPSISSLTD